jgi:hypothetical protein
MVGQDLRPKNGREAEEDGHLGIRVECGIQSFLKNGEKRGREESSPYFLVAISGLKEEAYLAENVHQCEGDRFRRPSLHRLCDFCGRVKQREQDSEIGCDFRFNCEQRFDVDETRDAEG